LKWASCFTIYGYDVTTRKNSFISCQGHRALGQEDSKGILKNEKEELPADEAKSFNY